MRIRLKQKRLAQIGIVVAVLAYVFAMVPINRVWALTGGGAGSAGPAGPAGATGSPGPAGTFSPPVSPVPTSVATAAATTFDLSQGLNRAITLNTTGAVFACTNPTAGITYKFAITQGSGGSKTVATWCSGTNWAGGTTGGGGAPTLSTAAGTIDIILCYYDGTYYDCDIEKGFVP